MGFLFEAGSGLNTIARVKLKAQGSLGEMECVCVDLPLDLLSTR